MGTGRILEENERLRALLVATHDVHETERVRHEAERIRLEQLLAEKDQKLAETAQESEAYREALERVSQQFDLLRAKLFGKKSERYFPGDAPVLPFNMPVPPPRQPQPEPAEPVEPPTPRKRGVQKRRHLEDNTEIPKTDIVCTRDPDATCAACHGALKDIGFAESWRLEWVPGHFLRHHIQRQKCVCPKCPGQGVLVAPEPNYALPKALCGNGLLASVLIDKYADHIPLDRQSRRMARVGVDLSTQVSCGWVQKGAEFFNPIVAEIYRSLLVSLALQADDTGYAVQDGTDGKLRNGRLWVVTNQLEAFYTFSPSKAGIYPAELLRGAKAKVLLTDGGGEFNATFETLGAIRAGCWSHLRRYFFDARDHHPVESHHALMVCRELFEIESRLWKIAPPDVIRRTRNEKSRPLVEAFFAWLTSLRATVRPKSQLGVAIGYAMNSASTFQVFLDHPELPLHNNLSELLLRGPVVGRKNWLFAGSEGGAQAGAKMFTLIGSCGLQGIDPWTWMVDVMARLQDHPASRISELTPRGWRLMRDGVRD